MFDPRNDKESLMRSTRIGLIAFMPICLYWIFREFFVESGLWVFYDHTEVLYYVSGIELAQGFVPTNVDNPGTIAQLVSMIIVKVIGSDPAHYELFIHIAHLTLLLLSLAAAIVITHWAARDLDWRIRVAGIWMFFCFSVVLTYLRVLGPEPFYFIVGALSLGSLFHISRNIYSTTLWKFVVFGASIGFLISVKFTFLAWLPGLCLISVLASNKLLSTQSIKNLFASLAGMAAGFLLVTLPIQDAYPYMFEWVLNNATNTGTYGVGASGLPELSLVLENWTAFLLSNKLWILAVTLISGPAIYYIVRLQDFQNNKSTLIVVVFALVSIAFSILFIMRSYHGRYMLPIGLCGVALLFCLAPTITAKYRVAPTVIALVFFILLIKSMNADYRVHITRVEDSKTLMDTLSKKIQMQADIYSLKNPVTIYGWRLAHPALALRQHYAQGDFLSKVDKLYPNDGHFTPWIKDNRFAIPSGKTSWDLAIINANHISEIKGIKYKIVDSYSGYKILKAIETN